MPGFDEAVERAIRKSEPFPADSSGKVPRNFQFTHRLKD
ncbi:MAG: TonB C-terminal domain-containing protein [Burkholderiales bacterium]